MNRRKASCAGTGPPQTEREAGDEGAVIRGSVAQRAPAACVGSGHSNSPCSVTGQRALPTLAVALRTGGLRPRTVGESGCANGRYRQVSGHQYLARLKGTTKDPRPLLVPCAAPCGATAYRACAAPKSSTLQDTAPIGFLSLMAPKAGSAFVMFLHMSPKRFSIRASISGRRLAPELI
jgi:hypothetical protein